MVRTQTTRPRLVVDLDYDVRPRQICHDYPVRSTQTDNQLLKSQQRQASCIGVTSTHPLCVFLRFEDEHWTNNASQSDNHKFHQVMLPFTFTRILAGSEKNKEVVWTCEGGTSSADETAERASSSSATYFSLNGGPKRPCPTNVQHWTVTLWTYCQNQLQNK